MFTAAYSANSEVQDASGQLTSSMNEGKRESDSRNKLVQPHRRLIIDGRLHLVRAVKKVNNRIKNPDGSASPVEVPCLSSDSNPKQLVAILCNDLLVLCKEPPVMEAGSQVELWAVLRMQTMAQPASIVSGNGLRIVDNKAIPQFNTPSTSEALTWQRDYDLKSSCKDLPFGQKEIKWSNFQGVNFPPHFLEPHDVEEAHLLRP